MIASFRHKGLARFHETGDKRGIDARHADWRRGVLTTLNRANGPADMNLPGFRLHALRGDRRGQWSVWVSGNWRLVFAFDGTDSVDVDLVDYH